MFILLILNRLYCAAIKRASAVNLDHTLLQAAHWSKNCHVMIKYLFLIMQKSGLKKHFYFFMIIENVNYILFTFFSGKSLSLQLVSSSCGHIINILTLRFLNVILKSTLVHFFMSTIKCFRGLLDTRKDFWKSEKIFALFWAA